MSVMSCAPTAKPDETAARPAPASHIARPGPQTKAVIALAGDAPAVHPMGDYWQAITYRRLARVAACSSRLYVGGNYMKGS
jgi:hypothetical protein